MKGVFIADGKCRILNADGELKLCPYYSIWSNLKGRCTAGSIFKQKCPSYLNVTIHNDWLRFSNFKSWMEVQPWEGNELDKDILVKGNKIYGPNTCRFVPRAINRLLILRVKKEGDLPIGVRFREFKNGEPYTAPNPYHSCVNIFGYSGKKKHLGSFNNAADAHRAWQINKAEQILEAVDWWFRDLSVRSSFQQDVADSLIERSIKLQKDAENYIQTFEL